MHQLSAKISELLFEYDCVILPDLGGFVTNYKPAEYNEDTQILYPPSKSIGFNSSLISNDGLLANRIAQIDNISFEDASSQIKAHVEDCFALLNAGNRVVFERVGILYFDENESIQFEPDESVNYLSDSFGLFELFLPKQEEIVEEEKMHIEREEIEAPIISIHRDKENERVEKKSEVQASHSIRKYIAAAVLFPVLFYIGLVSWQSQVFENGRIHSSDLNPFKSLAKKQYVERIAPYSLVEGDDLVVNIEVKKKTEEPKADPMSSLYANQEIANYPFHVITGCFSIQKNAEKHVRVLRKNGFRSFIIDKKGRLWRVSQGSFIKEEQAKNLLLQNRKEGNLEAWVLKK